MPGFEGTGVVVQFENSRTRCPRCGRPSRITDGTFEFSSAGIARALNAPQWSLDAIQTVQKELELAARALNDTRNYNDVRADNFLNRKIEAIESQNKELATELRALNKKLSRGKIAVVIGAIVWTLSLVADAGGAYEVTSDLIEWAVRMIESGQAPPLP